MVKRKKSTLENLQNNLQALHATSAGLVNQSLAMRKRIAAHQALLHDATELLSGMTMESQHASSVHKHYSIIIHQGSPCVFFSAGYL